MTVRRIRHDARCHPKLQVLSMTRSKAAFFLLISALFITQSLVQGSQSQAYSTGVAGGQPWRRSPYAQQRRTTRTRTRSTTAAEATRKQHTPDYSSHFLDTEDWLRDKKARLWQVDLKSRAQGTSWTTRITLFTIGVYAVQFFKPEVTQLGVKLSDKILRGEELYRLITPIFLHGGLGHLFSNMYSLNKVGPDFERLVGPGRYLATYAIAGVAGNLLSAMQSPNPALGASGAVFGVFGAYYVFLNRHEWLLGQQGEQMTAQVTQVIGMNLFLGLINPVIDNWGHLGGAIGGAAMAYYFGPRLFLTELPNEGGRIVVDKPVYRLPRVYEAIPERLCKVARRMTGWIPMVRYKAESTPKPWQKQGGSRPSQRRRDPRSAPNRSIKPDTTNF
jgi:membrane associated rhomboid family serine protease